MWDTLKESQESDLIFIKEKREILINLIDAVKWVNEISAKIQPTVIIGIGRKTNNPIGKLLYETLKTLSIYNQELLMGHLLPFFDYVQEKVENELKQINLMNISPKNRASPLT